MVVPSRGSAETCYFHSQVRATTTLYTFIDHVPAQPCSRPYFLVIQTGLDLYSLTAVSLVEENTTEPVRAL